MSRPALHREAIVRAAATLFRRQGYAATGINEILSLSGAPKGSLYHYFPGGKDEIAAAAVRFAGARIGTTIRELADSSGPVEGLGRYGALLGQWMEQSGFRDGCPVATVLLETAATQPGIAAAGKEALQSWIEALAAPLEAAGADGQAARQAARLAVMLLEGALLLARTEKSARPIAEAAREGQALFTRVLAAG